MKMNDEKLMCPQCFEILAKKNRCLSELYYHLCKAQGNLSHCKCVGDTPNLRTLELMKLVLTTDIDDWILIRVCQKTVPNENPFFCGGICGR